MKFLHLNVSNWDVSLENKINIYDLKCHKEIFDVF